MCYDAKHSLTFTLRNKVINNNENLYTELGRPMPSGITEAQRASGVNARITMGLSNLHSYIYVWLFFFFIFILRPSLLNTIAMPDCNKSNLNSPNMWHVLL